MREALAAGAVVAWATGAVALAGAAVSWTHRAGRRRLGLIGLGAILAVEVAWLGWVASRGLPVLFEPAPGGAVAGWIGWTGGVAGVIALIRGLTGAGGARGPDRAAQLGVGLFGVGILLRQLAATV